MSHRTAVWALFALGALGSAGCADEVEARPAAYPEPIGYTTPPADPPPAPAAQPAAAASGVASDSPAEDEVIVDGTEPAPSPPAAAPAPPPDDTAGDTAVYGDADPAALSDFRGTLDPYGTWADDPTYGTVWAPSSSVVGDDFTPYVSGGHWAYDSDYVWVSDYSWGWAPFHYGRWVYSGSGWVWIPGRRYAGAWVSWRYGEGAWGYVGWAPLAPRWCWRGGGVAPIGFVPSMPYSFVPRTELFTPIPGARLVSGPAVASVAAHTRPYVVASPSVVGTGGVPGGVRLASGPSPAFLSIPASSVVHTTPVDRGVVQARAFAAPRSAIALGARPPQALPATAWQSRATTTLTGNFRPVAPAAAEPSHFGGRLGAGFTGNAYAAARPVPVAPYTGRPTPLRGPVRLAPGAAYSPAYRTGPTPIYRSAEPATGYSSAPVRSAPTFRSAAPAAPSGGFHGGGSYGGFHGGGGGRSSGGRGGGHR